MASSLLEKIEKAALRRFSLQYRQIHSAGGNANALRALRLKMPSSQYHKPTQSACIESQLLSSLIQFMTTESTEYNRNQVGNEICGPSYSVTNVFSSEKAFCPFDLSQNGWNLVDLEVPRKVQRAHEPLQELRAHACSAAEIPTSTKTWRKRSSARRAAAAEKTYASGQASLPTSL